MSAYAPQPYDPNAPQQVPPTAPTPAPPYVDPSQPQPVYANPIPQQQQIPQQQIPQQIPQKQEYGYAVQQVPQQQLAGQQPMPQQKQQYANATPIQSLGRGSAPVDCPACGQRALTRIQYETGNSTHAWALAACCCLCLGCIPYLMNSLKDVVHNCGNCGVLLATWHRSGTTEAHMH